MGWLPDLETHRFTHIVGAAAGIRTRVPGCFLTGWEAGVIDQAARRHLNSGIQVLALDHGRQPDPLTHTL